jgi:hypothetical protein
MDATGEPSDQGTSRLQQCYSAQSELRITSGAGILIGQTGPAAATPAERGLMAVAKTPRVHDHTRGVGASG